MSEHNNDTIQNDVETIMQLAQDYDLDALTVVDGDFELSLTRREPQPAAPIGISLPTASSGASAALAPSDKPIDQIVEPIVPQGNTVTAPIIGVFYRASSPAAPPFVNVGDRVAIGQTLCILEAMKLMNEITSDFNGIVTAIHVENTDLVTIGQPLFTLSSG